MLIVIVETVSENEDSNILLYLTVFQFVLITIKLLFYYLLNSITTARQGNTTSMSGRPQSITLGSQFSTVTPTTPYSSVSSSASTTLSSGAHSVLTVSGPNVSSYSAKTGLWLKYDIYCCILFSNFNVLKFISTVLQCQRRR